MVGNFDSFCTILAQNSAHCCPNQAYCLCKCPFLPIFSHFCPILAQFLPFSTSLSHQNIANHPPSFLRMRVPAPLRPSEGYRHSRRPVAPNYDMGWYLLCPKMAQNRPKSVQNTRRSPKIGPRYSKFGPNWPLLCVSWALKLLKQQSGGAVPLRRPKRSLNTHPQEAWGVVGDVLVAQ